MSAPPPPARLGSYELVRELGRGGMGTVWLARDPALSREVAIKTLALARSRTSWERLVREARAAARLSHPNLIRVHAFEPDADPPYLVLERIVGGTLAQLLPSAPRERLLSILARVARALEAAHAAGIAHRDVKPGNVLIEEETGRPVLTDFGLALVLPEEGSPEERLTRSGVTLGTLEYLSPEQAAGRRDAQGPPADVWALGVLLYRILTGRLPFAGGTPVEVMLRVTRAEPVPPSRLAGVSPGLERLCLSALSRAPGDRPGAGAFASRLEQELSRAEAATGELPVAGTTPGAGGRRRLALAALGLLALPAALALALRARPVELLPRPVPRPAPELAPAPRPEVATPVDSLPDRASWRLVKLVQGREPRGCFEGDEVLLWTGEGLARCPRSATTDFPALESLPGSELPGVVPTAFVASVGGNIYLGSERPDALRAWSQGRWTTVLSEGRFGAAIQGARWLAAMDHEAGGGVLLVDGTGVDPLVRLPCPDPRGGLLRESEGEGELVVCGRGLESSVLRRFVRERGTWVESRLQLPSPPWIRCFDLHPSVDLIVIGDDSGGILEARRDTGATVARYAGPGVAGNAHANSLRAVAWARGEEALISLAVAGEGEVELVVWDTTTRARIVAWTVRGHPASRLTWAPDRERFLLATGEAVYLLARG